MRDVPFQAPSLLVIGLLLAVAAGGCRSSTPDVVRVRASRIALTNVDVVDGTGGPVREDQTLLIDHDRIAAVGPAAETTISPDSQVLRLPGYTVIPGLVGMHDHLFYAVDGGHRYISVPRSFAHLYLAAGVTTLRTAGTTDLQRDIDIKREIDEGREVGPTIHLSSTYIGRRSDLATVVREINALADAGVTSIKVYTDVRRDELATAIGTAHRRGLKVTGHLCAVGFRQAAALGIDNLEHGLLVDTEFYSRKIADQCPDWGATVIELARTTVGSAPIQETIRELVSRGVAVTSTLALFEAFARPTSVDQRLELLLNRSALRNYRQTRQQRSANQMELGIWEKALRVEMDFERSFVSAGGMLLACADPTGWGGVLAGLGDQRNVELLVEAGFTPEQAIQIASANGAEFLGESATIGTVTPGKRADLAVIRGSLVSDIRNIRNVEIVFKDGVGFDSATLMQTEYGRIGETNWRAWVAGGIGILVFLVLIVRAQLARRAKRRAYH